MRDLLKMIKSDLKYIVDDLLQHGKSISAGEIKDERNGFHSQYMIKAKIGLDEDSQKTD
ncbi:hypothetical protein ACJ2A9_00480 [Anaerobacillus sp. MEB173]|uniref:hypothetical protein n=1 Tax=Anaerobacillus sp. MEB173 TaxID=3383345 RepID=UPI003F8E3F8A